MTDPTPDPSAVSPVPGDPVVPAAARQMPVFESRRDMLLYLWIRIRTTRRYWLIPVLLVVALGAMLLNLFTGHNVLPAIYSLIP